jgi:hypothetical protein|tara:strand:- start:3316 stop:3531 length:216 start_codon:yes stop_codon:yes gene_type:complete
MLISRHVRARLTQHLEEQEETYFQHFVVAFLTGLKIMGLGSLCIIHAFLPFCFEKTASTQLQQMLARLERK